jgi:uncharacterized protein
VKVVIAGGSGLIGRSLTRALVSAGGEVIVLTRHALRAPSDTQSPVRSLAWDAQHVQPQWCSSLVDADAIINLAGASIGSRPWTAMRKAEILTSRVDATRALVDGVVSVPSSQRPKVLVNASGIDYYGNRPEDEITEEASPGDSFLAHVCVQWEGEAERACDLGVRVVRMRTAVVLAREAMTLRLLTLPFRLFVGGPLGDGCQWFSWIHLDDVVGLYLLAVDRDDLAGPLNTVAPDVRRQHEVAKEIGSLLRRPALVRAPAGLLRLMMRSQADLLLHGRRAVPEKALRAGYRFQYPNLPDALRASLGQPET